MKGKLLDGKVIIITGGSGGIGSACAEACAAEGAGVCILGRNRERLNSVLASLPVGNHKIYELDLFKEDSIKATIEQICHDYDRIDGFIHAAGYEITKPLRKTGKEDFLKLYEINTVSAFSIIREILRKKTHLVKPLSFVVISSVMGNLGERGKIAYCASKGGLQSSVKALALELAAKRHRINTISPGMVRTALTEAMLKEYPADMKEEIEKRHPLGFGKPEDVANLAVFLISEKSSWITGSDIVIDGGYSAI